MIAADATMSDWLQLIRAEYLEFPGLHLTRRQIERLWSLDPAVCDCLLDALVDARFLRRTRNDAYVRDVPVGGGASLDRKLECAGVDGGDRRHLHLPTARPPSELTDFDR